MTSIPDSSANHQLSQRQQPAPNNGGPAGSSSGHVSAARRTQRTRRGRRHHANQDGNAVQGSPPAVDTSGLPIEIIATPGPGKNNVNLIARRGSITFVVQTFPTLNEQRKFKFAAEAGVGLDEVEAAIARMSERPEPAATPTTEFSLVMRGMHQQKIYGRTITNVDPLVALREALTVADYAGLEPVIEWHDMAALVVLDVDYHDLELAHRPRPNQLEALARLVRPRPAMYWHSHGRGLHMVYAAREGFTAEDLAWVAALSVRGLDSSTDIEVKKQTRHPGYPRPDHSNAGPVVELEGDTDVTVLRSAVGAEGGFSWLEEHGLVIGSRYDHSRCPVAPEVEGHGDPVIVNEGDVFCEQCAADGTSIGLGPPGLFPFSALIGGAIGGWTERLILNCARHCCHWEHARLVLAAETAWEGKHARHLYCALLKSLHGPDNLLVAKAMTGGRNLVRVGDWWMTADLSRDHRREGLEVRLSKLPAVQYIETRDDGSVVSLVNSEKLAIFRGVDDLTPSGYPSLRPIRGIKMAGRFDEVDDDEGVEVVVLPKYLRRALMAYLRPKYLPADQRMPMSEAAAVLDWFFPGINLNYLQLIIAARGFADSGKGQPPRIAVSGPSGSGKTATVIVGATALGDEHRDVQWVPSERFLQGLGEASRYCGLVSSDEIIKLASAKGGDALRGLTPLLSFQAGLSYHRLFHGPAIVDRVPVLVITDISFPPQVLSDEQLGRRFVHVKLDRKVNWQWTAERIEQLRATLPESAATVGNTKIEQFRKIPEFADAANAIVSDVIDRFFGPGTSMTFEDVARALGFGMLNEAGDDGIDPTTDLRRLFEVVCSGQGNSPPPSSLSGRGWKHVQLASQDPIATAWKAVCDDFGLGFTSSRRAKAVDWSQLLSVEPVVEIDIHSHSISAVSIRFRVGNARSPQMLANEEIAALRPSLPPPAASECPAETPNTEEFEL